MPSPRLIVEISPSRVEVAVLRGAVVAEWRSERFPRAEWPSPYTTALPEVAASISRLLADLGVTGGAATVVYSAPGSVSAVTSFAANVGAGASEKAALLSLANVADFPIDDAPSDTCLVFTDKVSKPAKDSSEPAPEAQRHILAAADAEPRADALTAAVEAAALSVDRVLPADAVCLTDAIRAAAAAGSPGDITAVIWIAEHATNLAVAAHGRLLFVRTIATGTESLAEVLCRPLRPRAADAQPITLAHDDARALLFSAGIPAPEDAIPNYPTLAGSALLPHLQPVLQRLFIEIKQSLRFGVPENDRTKVRLRLAGPGAAIPGLGDSIARASGFPFDPPAEGEAADGVDSSGGGTIAALIRSPHLTLALMPTRTREIWKMRRSRKALIAGALVALAYVGYETIDTHFAIAAEHARLISLTSALQSDQGPLAVRQATMTAHKQVAEAEHRVLKTVDLTADWSALLDAVAEQTPAQIRLTSLDMHRDALPAANATLTLRAYLRVEEAPDPAQFIHAYVARLEALPIVSSVRLVSAQRTTIAAHDAQSFDLNISVVSIPALHGPAPYQAVASSPSPSEVK